MTKTELLELIENLENSGVEFKRDTISNRELAKELVALANLQGGHVLLGVEDGGTVCGLTKSDPVEDANDAESSAEHTYQRLEEWVMQTCRDKIRPELNPYFHVWRDVRPGADVAVIRIDRGWSVHHVWHSNHRTYYVRVGSTSREASPEELARLFQQRGSVRLERQPVSGTSIHDLDRRRLADYFDKVRGPHAPESEPSEVWRNDMRVWAEREAGRHWRLLFQDLEREWRETQENKWRTLLVNTEFLAEEEPLPATVAGLVLFGVEPHRFLPQSKIDATAYLGTEKDYDAKERLTLRGPLVRLHAADGTVLEPGLAEQAVDFVRRNINTVLLEDGVRRSERWDYPEEALRETIVNAIVHRDYMLSNSDIELSIYSDRIEVVSPGRLSNGITPERMRAGCRAARNELIKDVMRDYGYLEHTGMGVPRKIVRGMQEHNGTDPDFEEEGERFVVRLWKNPPADAE